MAICPENQHVPAIIDECVENGVTNTDAGPVAGLEISCNAMTFEVRKYMLRLICLVLCRIDPEEGDFFRFFEKG